MSASRNLFDVKIKATIEFLVATLTIVTLGQICIELVYTCIKPLWRMPLEVGWSCCSDQTLTTTATVITHFIHFYRHLHKSSIQANQT